jgi:hypothetical protein
MPTSETLLRTQQEPEAPGALPTPENAQVQALKPAAGHHNRLPARGNIRLDEENGVWINSDGQIVYRPSHFGSNGTAEHKNQPQDEEPSRPTKESSVAAENPPIFKSVLQDFNSRNGDDTAEMPAVKPEQAKDDKNLWDVFEDAYAEYLTDKDAVYDTSRKVERRARRAGFRAMAAAKRAVKKEAGQDQEAEPKGQGRVAQYLGRRAYEGRHRQPKSLAAALEEPKYVRKPRLSEIEKRDTWSGFKRWFKGEKSQNLPVDPESLPEAGVTEDWVERRVKARMAAQQRRLETYNKFKAANPESRPLTLAYNAAASLFFEGLRLHVFGSNTAGRITEASRNLNEASRQHLAGVMGSLAAWMALKAEDLAAKPAVSKEDK